MPPALYDTLIPGDWFLPGQPPPPPPAPEAPGAPPVAPQALAERAARQLRLPLPTPRHSPDLRHAGQAATVVGEHTWIWTDRVDWQPQTERVQAGPVWVEVQATPQRLSFSPGNGEAPVNCPGPGTAYSPAIGPHAASPDCDVVYQHSSTDAEGGTVPARWVITWAISWRGFDGRAPQQGRLPSMTSTAQVDLAVLEAQALRIQ